MWPLGRGTHPVDFLIGSLVVEVDGPRHRQAVTWLKDLLLDNRMVRAGFRVVRVRNETVFADVDRVAREIARFAQETSRTRRSTP